MGSKFESLQFLSEEEVIEVLDSREFNSPEAITIFGRYADQCHVEADRKADADRNNPVSSNRANIEAEIKIALVMLKSSRYKSEGIESLEETLIAAKQSETTVDLVEEIETILSRKL